MNLPAKRLQDNPSGVTDDSYEQGLIVPAVSLTGDMPRLIVRGTEEAAPPRAVLTCATRRHIGESVITRGSRARRRNFPLFTEITKVHVGVVRLPPSQRRQQGPRGDRRCSC
ncbi:hypothetical protein MATL_G00142940 [Megalops atlanticus]|uniref:Uncharacterized protein n=1 Tax=Megalops atlanticus TaxID=7932 RepID=A0A9D3PW39_MEGAT|nr:hypothetical protein MATL_G00142940 [Megalops atlanticus]